MSHFADRNVRRLTRLRYLLPLLVLAVVTIVLVPAGAAKPPTQQVKSFSICVQNATTALPDCSLTAPSSFDGNSLAKVMVSISNPSTSTVALNSATITVPGQFRITNTPAAPDPASKVTWSGQALQVSNIMLQPGAKPFVVTFYARTACDGSGTWAASASPSSGSDFEFDQAASVGLTSNITTACHLAFTAQPTDTGTGETITDAGASTGDAITVGLFDNANHLMTTCPFGSGNCAVDMAIASGGAGTLSPNPAQATLPADGNDLVASFSSLSISAADSSLPAEEHLSATGDGGLVSTAATSDPFLITKYARGCDTGNSCSFSQKLLHNDTSTDSFADVSGLGLTFMTLSPFNAPSGTNAPTGCAGFTTIGAAGVAETDGRINDGGAMTIRYYVNQKKLQARYGKNVGQQFVPICAGAKPVGTDGTIHNCFDPGYDQVEANPSLHGWVGDQLDSTGRFTGAHPNAICGADGFYWGILGSYQDKLNASATPLVTNWGGQNINGTSYRFFDISVPGNWDWRAGT